MQQTHFFVLFNHWITLQSSNNTLNAFAASFPGRVKKKKFGTPDILETDNGIEYII